MTKRNKNLKTVLKDDIHTKGLKKLKKSFSEIIKEIQFELKLNKKELDFLFSSVEKYDHLEE